MRTIRILTGCVCAALAWNQARMAMAQSTLPSAQPNSPVSVVAQAPAGPQAPAAPKAPTTPQAPAAPAPLSAPPAAPVLGEAAPAGTEACSGAYAPQMLGDSLAYLTRGQFGTVIVGPLIPGSTSLLIDVPVASLAGSAFKIADNDSPIPMDRCFLDLNYFTAVNHSIRPGGSPQLRVARELFGYEKTFLDGDASIEVRAPFFQLHDSAGGSFSDFGDITLIAKFALLRDTSSGSVLTAGLALTLPTGPNTTVTSFTPPTPVNPFGTASTTYIDPTIIQPFLGYLVYPMQDLYIHGFSSLAFATGDQVPTVWFNDIGAGYFVYRGDKISVIPTAELHLTTPFGHIGSQGSPIGVIDTLVATLGVHALWHDGTILTFGWGFPLTGPQPFANELLLQLNHRF
jgi:hypothetical protein